MIKPGDWVCVTTGAGWLHNLRVLSYYENDRHELQDLRVETSPGHWQQFWGFIVSDQCPKCRRIRCGS